MRFRSSCRPGPRCRAGLTLVEVLVALVIVTVGLLGMAGTSALSLRAATAATRERRVVALLGRRLAELAAAGCQRAASGSAVDTDGVSERWAVAGPVRGAALIEAGAEWVDQGGLRSTTLRSALLC